MLLLPLNGAWRFGADVIDHPVDPMYFVDDAVGEFSKKFVGQVSPVSSHAVGTGNGADGHYIFVGAGIAHDPYCFYRKQDCERLP